MMLNKDTKCHNLISCFFWSSLKNISYLVFSIHPEIIVTHNMLGVLPYIIFQNDPTSVKGLSVK